MKITKATLIVFSMIIAAGLILQAFSKNRNAGKVSISDLEVGEFKTLSVEGCMDIIVAQGSAADVRIEGDKTLADKIEFERKGDELIVKFNEKNVNCYGKSVMVYLSSPAIEHINLAGSGNITSSNQINSNDGFEIDLAGSGTIDIELNAYSLTADIAGSGNIELDGKTNEMIIDIAGSGNFRGSKLIAGGANIDIAGSGNAYINTSGNITADIAGSGNILYSGTPGNIKKDIVGSGKVKAAN